MSHHEGMPEPPNPVEAAARALTLAGFALCKPLPETKRPDMAGWSTYSLPPEGFGPGDLIGTLGGPLSHANVPGHALVIVDLDAAVALELADRHLPDTGMVDGRASKRRSHRYYLVPLDGIPEWARSQAGAAAPAAEKFAQHPGPFKKGFNLADDSRAIDFIGTGGMAVCPPSLHPSGEPREWEGGERGDPAVVPFADLWRAVCRLAEACGCKPPSDVGWPWETKQQQQRSAPRADRAHDRGQVVNRAIAYLAKCPGAVSKAHGHDATFYVARAVVYGFDLGAEDGFDLLKQYFNPKCRPEWSDRELMHKCQDADDLPFGEPRGWLRDKDRPNWNMGWTNGAQHSPGANGRHQANDEHDGEDRPAPETSDVAADPHQVFDDTDVHNGRRFIADHGANVRYVADMGFWFVFDGRRWVPDWSGTAVERLAKSTVCLMAQEAFAELAAAAQRLKDAGDNDDEQNAAKKAMKAAEKKLAHAKKSQDVRAYRRLLAAAQSEPAVCVREARELFDRPHDLLNCPNGTVELRTGTLRPHCRTDFLTKLCPIAFNPSAPRGGYLSFLNRIFRDKPAVAAYVRQLSGYVATAETTVHATNFFHGTGANGKSVLVGLWTRVLDEYAYTAPPELLMKDERGTRHPTEKAGLRGARLVLCSETAEDAALDEAKLKALSSSDAITARVMRGDFFTFQPTHKTVVSTNHRPRVKGTDHGIWRRLRLVPFEVKFWTDADREADPAGTFDLAFKAIPGLEDALFAEEAEGILADMVEHAVAFYATGLTLTPPAEVTAATNEYRQAEDLVAQFVEARVRRDNIGDGVKGAELYKAFKGWWVEQGHPEKRVLGLTQFGTSAKRLLPSAKRSSVVYLVRVLEKDE